MEASALQLLEGDSLTAELWGCLMGLLLEEDFM